MEGCLPLVSQTTVLVIIFLMGVYPVSRGGWCYQLDLYSPLQSYLIWLEVGACEVLHFTASLSFSSWSVNKQHWKHNCSNTLRGCLLSFNKHQRLFAWLTKENIFFTTDATNWTHVFESWAAFLLCVCISSWESEGSVYFFQWCKEQMDSAVLLL